MVEGQGFSAARNVYWSMDIASEFLAIIAVAAIDGDACWQSLPLGIHSMHRIHPFVHPVILSKGPLFIVFICLLQLQVQKDC